jgi:hypothetical protein
MTNTISFSDVANLSSYLDNQLSQVEKTRLESQIKNHPELVEILEDLREARHILRQTPRRRVPRNFTLTPKMAGIKPPVPRLVPAFSWASAVAMVFFLFTLGSSLVGKMSFGMAARIAAAPQGYGMGGGPPAAEGPYPETAAEDSSLTATATPEMMLMTLPEATSMPEERAIESEDNAAKTPPALSPWLLIWPAVAVVLVGGALLLRWRSIRSFRRKNRQ